MSTLVMKFGGAAVKDVTQFSSIADLIIEKKCLYQQIVVVVSAMGETTNQLIHLAKQVHPNPPQRECDMLISVGERISMSLLAMALCLKGQEAISLTGSQAGIMTCQKHGNAMIMDVKPDRLLEILKQGKIAIVAGFQGVSKQREITTLGRGGSDTTAVALGIALEADYIEFYKDVNGIYDEDPKKNSEAIQFDRLSYKAALEIVENGARILHPRAIKLASENGVRLYVRSFMSKGMETKGTWIDSDVTQNKKFLKQYEMSG